MKHQTLPALRRFVSAVARSALRAGLVLGLAAGLTAQTSVPAQAADPVVKTSTTSKVVDSLRGGVAIEATSDVNDISRVQRDAGPIPRDFVQQPPLIPHATKGYQITKNFNKCMDCHAWSKSKDTGATKVSLTHFKDRDGNELQNVSPRRYFCTQCHVPQADAKPLVNNTFTPLESVSSRK